jgi:NAD(P)-dependent dehydrogenase (short-subunit alcohol dehydrogenase family)
VKGETVSETYRWPGIAFDYRGASVLVTGATSGIGEAVARAYAEAGATVTITGTRASAREYGSGLDGFAYRRLRVENSDEIAAVAASLPALDVLVNNAGAVYPDGKSEDDPEVFEKAVRINLFGAYRMAHACRAKLAASKLAGGASIVGIASMTSFFGNEAVPGYGAAKAALVQLTKTLAIAWARDRIRANAVAAGLIETAMTKAMIEANAHEPYVARTALGRIGTPRDVAATVLFLTSPAAAYVTGQTWAVDGGYSIRG